MQNEPPSTPQPAPGPEHPAPLGLYIHVPFCSAICNYCNFNRGLFDASLKERYLAALLQEIRSKADGTAADTVFFGGGTPSLLEPSEVRSVVDVLECHHVTGSHTFLLKIKTENTSSSS